MNLYPQYYDLIGQEYLPDVWYRSFVTSQYTYERAIIYNTEVFKLYVPEHFTCTVQADFLHSTGGTR